MKIKLSIFGSSEIINHHIKAAKKNSFQIISICTSNKNSKNVSKFQRNIKLIEFSIIGNHLLKIAKKIIAMFLFVEE